VSAAPGRAAVAPTSLLSAARRKRRQRFHAYGGFDGNSKCTIQNAKTKMQEAKATLRLFSHFALHFAFLHFAFCLLHFELHIH
jgi:hypothetical protein